MRSDIHPPYHKITVTLVNGDTFTTGSTYGSEGSVVHLDTDPSVHPAWTKTFRNESSASSKAAKFKQYYGDEFFQ